MTLKTTYLNMLLSFVICLMAIVTIPSSYAANSSENDEVQSLGDILNPQVDDMKDAITGKDMANVYYKRCVKTKSLAFDKEEKELLCACQSAKMDEILTIPEFKILYEDSYKGRDARGKVIAYAYTDCMGYVIESKVHKDCMVSPVLNKVIRGKKQICECAAKKYNDIIHRDVSHVIMNSIKHDPMTLNPLERYFTNVNYKYMYERYTDYCRSKMIYEKHN